MTVILPAVGADRALLDPMTTDLSRVLASFTSRASATLTMPRFRLGFGASLRTCSPAWVTMEGPSTAGRADPRPGPALRLRPPYSVFARGTRPMR